MNLTTIKDAIASWVETASGLPVLWGGENAPRPTGDVPYIELRLRATGGGMDWVDLERNVLELDDDDVEAVDTVANTLTLTGHEYESGDGPVQFETDDTLPAPLEPGVDYWLIVIDEDTVQVAENFPRAIAAVPTPIDLTSSGSGNHTIIGQPTTMRAGEEAFYRVRGPRVMRLSMQCFADPSPTAADSADPSAILLKVRALAECPPHDENLNTAGVGLGEFGDVVPLDGLIGATLFEPRATMEVPINLAEEESAPAQIIERLEVEVEVDDVSIGIVYIPDDPDA